MFYAMKEMLVLIKCAVNVDAEMVSFMICMLSLTELYSSRASLETGRSPNLQNNKDLTLTI